MDPGVIAKDAVDGEITVTKEGTVDTENAGEYLITYSVKDRAGNRATKARRIIVADRIVESAMMPQARLYFGFDKDSDPVDENDSLTGVVSYMQNNPEAIVYVSGFHDRSGNYYYNQDLANRRAKAVLSMLKEMGVIADRIVVKKPVETLGTGAPREARRVEVTVGM